MVLHRMLSAMEAGWKPAPRLATLPRPLPPHRQLPLLPLLLDAGADADADAGAGAGAGAGAQQRRPASHSPEFQKRRLT